MGEDQALRAALASLLRVNLGLEEDESLLLLGDRGDDADDPALVLELAELLEELHPLSRTLVYPSTGRSGVEPPPPAWEAAFGADAFAQLSKGGLLERLRGKEAREEDLERARGIAREAKTVDTVVALSHHSTSHTAFRRLLTAEAGVRFASMPRFTREMFFGPMAVDWRRLAESTRTLARAMEGASCFEVEAPNGTRLLLEAGDRPRMADTGLLTGRGSFGNLPAGEVFLAPLEGASEGVLVVEWGPGARLERPIAVTVREGRAVSLEGGTREESAWLEGLLSAHPGNANLAELGVGTNPGARRPDNILESEKILGTVHIAFGDNHTFGGETVAPFHLDFVVFSASLTGVWEGGRRLLLSRGRPGWL